MKLYHHSWCYTLVCVLGFLCGVVFDGQIIGRWQTEIGKVQSHNRDGRLCVPVPRLAIWLTRSFDSSKNIHFLHWICVSIVVGDGVLLQPWIIYYCVRLFSNCMLFVDTLSYRLCAIISTNSLTEPVFYTVNRDGSAVYICCDLEISLVHIQKEGNAMVLWASHIKEPTPIASYFRHSPVHHCLRWCRNGTHDPFTVSNLLSWELYVSWRRYFQFPFSIVWVLNTLAYLNDDPILDFTAMKVISQFVLRSHSRSECDTCLQSSNGIETFIAFTGRLLSTTYQTTSREKFPSATANLNAQTILLGYSTNGRTVNSAVSIHMALL